MAARPFFSLGAPRVLRGIAALTVVLTAACGSGEEGEPAPSAPEPQEMPEGGPLDWPVDQPGPFHVGYRRWTITYSPPRGGLDQREIALNLWYPTLDTTGQNPAYLNVFTDKDVFDGASLAPPVEPAGYPVHVYSHGNAGFGGTSADMMHWFASHGWLAVAPDHAGNTLPEHRDRLPIAIWYLRSMDVTATLDALEALPADDPLSGKARTDRVLLSGHSFGSFTVWASGGAALDLGHIQSLCDAGDAFSEPCSPDDLAAFTPGLGDARVAAGLPMAGGDSDEPGWFGASGHDAAARPFLLMTGSEDPVGAEHVFARVSAIDFTWLDFVGGCHQLFALGGCRNFEEHEGWALVNTYALAFARRRVLDDSTARVTGILDGTVVLSPKITYRHR